MRTLRWVRIGTVLPLVLTLVAGCDDTAGPDATGPDATGPSTGAPLPPLGSVSPLAFVRGEQIYVINPDGTGLIQLTSSGSNWEPAWSPDGRRIAYSSFGQGGSDIFVMSADGTNVVRRTSTGGWQPAWSPDGRQIAFVSARDGNPEIYVMSADDDGTSPTRLTSNPGDDMDPAWSPDGRTIAFASYRDGTLDVYTMNPDGSGVTKLTRGIPDILSYSKPAWSPDGRKLAFVSERCSGDATCPFQGWWDYGDFPVYSVVVANADGSGATPVASTPSANSVDRVSITSRPAWSPDGRTIAFSWEGSGYPPSASINYVTADGSGVPVFAFNGYSPSWRR